MRIPPVISAPESPHKSLAQQSLALSYTVTAHYNITQELTPFESRRRYRRYRRRRRRRLTHSFFTTRQNSYSCVYLQPLREATSWNPGNYRPGRWKVAEKASTSNSPSRREFPSARVVQNQLLYGLRSPCPSRPINSLRMVNFTCNSTLDDLRSEEAAVFPHVLPHMLTVSQLAGPKSPSSMASLSMAWPWSLEAVLLSSQ